VVFSIGQNIGGLAGSAIVGTAETIRQRVHYAHLAEGLTLGDPDVVLRLQQLSGAYAPRVTDPALRSAEGLRLFQQQITQQSHVLAYNDVFFALGVAAALGSVWVTIHHIRTVRRARAAAEQAAAAATVAQ
jgi:hypothetical protein